LNKRGRRFIYSFCGIESQAENYLMVSAILLLQVTFPFVYAQDLQAVLSFLLLLIHEQQYSFLAPSYTQRIFAVRDIE